MSARAKDMPLQGHLVELRSRLIRAVIAIIIVTVFAASFGIRSIELNGYTFYYPFPDPLNNISVQLTDFMRDTLLPPNVQLIQTAPGQAFFAQIYVSLLIGVIVSIPVITREIVAFISPAFESNKPKRKIVWISTIIPMIALFAAGAIFSYILVIPFVLQFLYNYGQAIGVATFFNVNEFISFVLQFLIGIGIAFELPVIMYAISLSGIIDARFWRKNFRYSIVIFVVFGAIITPDGSGITMWLMTGPMIGLYLVGLVVIERKERITERKVQREAAGLDGE
jgi:sec-independent protein translocase protein TatC